MDLRSAYPYWLLKDGIIQTYPSLTNNTKTEIAVIGAGITGVLVAWHLCSAGFKVVIVDKRHVGMGSTAASTGLLQYEIDTPLHRLIKRQGEKDAVDSYLLCLQSIYDLEEICKKLKDAAGFQQRPSMQYASVNNDVPLLQREYKARLKAGIQVDWLDGRDIRDKFGFVKKGALLSAVGAEINAYRLTHNLIQTYLGDNLSVFDHTEITGIRYHKRGVEVTTADGYRLTANKLVMACGYESQKYLPEKVEKIYSTYAIVSEPLPSRDLWYNRSLIWETARPYLYLRTSDDNRVLMGGKDDAFSNPHKRDSRIADKAKALERSFRLLFPDIPFKTDFKWAGAFAATKDGLPYIGSISKWPDTFFALGFGGNGITFSVIGAQIILAKLKGLQHRGMHLFRFGR